MNFEIVSKFANFKNTILYKNRFFISQHPFLIDFQKHIEKDLEREKPIMIAQLAEGSVLYRARIIDRHIDSSEKFNIAELMRQCSIEYSMIEKCTVCNESSNDKVGCGGSSSETAESFRHSAAEKWENLSFSSESNFNGFSSQESSLPPKEKCDIISDMRANPKYIRYLYAANDKYTALLEARAGISSLVSVADIEVISPLRILDITNIKQYKTDDDELFLLLQELNNEFSTPATGELKDYLASQVISEFIKSMDLKPNFDGICFRSSLNAKGKNYTIFSENKFKPVSSDVYYISEVGLTAYGVTENSIISSK
ncbi:MAG: RES family NAD+ phosphorylase [Coprobacillus sp.]